MDRVFLDANVLYSAAYLEQSGLARLWTLDDVDLRISAYGLEEARRNLVMDRLKRLRGWSGSARRSPRSMRRRA